MSRKPDFRPLLFWLFIATALALVLRFVFGYDYPWSIGIAVIVLLSVFLNGLLAAWEDEQPGGYNNPLPSEKKKLDDERE